MAIVPSRGAGPSNASIPPGCYRTSPRLAVTLALADENLAVIPGTAGLSPDVILARASPPSYPVIGAAQDTVRSEFALLFSVIPGCGPFRQQQADQNHSFHAVIPLRGPSQEQQPHRNHPLHSLTPRCRGHISAWRPMAAKNFRTPLGPVVSNAKLLERVSAAPLTGLGSSTDNRSSASPSPASSSHRTQKNKGERQGIKPSHPSGLVTAPTRSFNHHTRRVCSQSPGTPSHHTPVRGLIGSGSFCPSLPPHPQKGRSIWLMAV